MRFPANLDLSKPAPKHLGERLTLPGQFKGYVELVAHAYKAAPKDDGSFRAAFPELKKHIEKLFDRVQGHVRVVFSENGGVNGDYEDAADMSDKVRRTGVLYIDSSHNDHPMFDKLTNLKFRAVHDYLAHIGGDHAFDARGEIAAYNRHVKLAPPSTKPILFTEVVGQASYYLTFGSFGPQKTSTLFGFDYDHLGRVDPKEYARNFRAGQVPAEVRGYLTQIAKADK
ncbi:MAG: hypothetical protein E6R03_01650 [Hyphomicrobiaceae bacterium]|nr:MAG: hypothetical protein E6R03_01650 [Hyphomicrobiaceae bacterium]